jgi:membrane protein
MTTAGPPNARMNELAKRLVKAAQKFNEDDMLTYAAALSYQVFFSLFPFLIVLVALLGSLNIPGFFDWMLDQARAVLPEQALEIVEQVLGQIRGQAQTFLSLGIIVALWSASAAVRMTMHALDVAYDVEEERPAWKKFPLSLLYTILLTVLIIVAVGLMLIGPQVVQWLAEQVGLGSVFVALWGWLRIPAAVLLLMVGLVLVYAFFPNIDFPLRFIAPGAVLAVILWLGASLGFSFYVNNFSSYSATYGSIAAIIVLLLYLYLSACVLLLGAEVNAQIYYQFAEGQDADEKAQEVGPSEE